MNNTSVLLMQAFPTRHYIKCKYHSFNHRTLQNYLVFMVLRLGFSYLPSKFDDMVTNFYRGIFGSYSGSSNSWEACLSRAGGALPYAQGALFVNGNFDEEDKEQV